MEIIIEVGGLPTAGMFVILKFLTARKNPYELAFGPSNEMGKIEVSGDHILCEARKVADLFPMDYWNIEVDWTCAIHVTPMNRDSLARALSAARLFRSFAWIRGVFKGCGRHLSSKGESRNDCNGAMRRKRAPCDRDSASVYSMIKELEVRT